MMGTAATVARKVTKQPIVARKLPTNNNQEAKEEARTTSTRRRSVRFAEKLATWRQPAGPSRAKQVKEASKAAKAAKAASLEAKAKARARKESLGAKARHFVRSTQERPMAGGMSPGPTVQNGRTIRRGIGLSTRLSKIARQQSQEGQASRV